MAKIAKHFTVTKHLPGKLGSIEFSGIVYNNEPHNYDIEDVRFHTTCIGKPVTEDVSQFFKMFRETTDPEFHHRDIEALLTEWLDARPAVGNAEQHFTGPSLFDQFANICKAHNELMGYTNRQNHAA